MRTVGVRELRQNTAKILSDVSEKGESIQVTNHGKVVAHVVPPPKQVSPGEIRQLLERAHRLMEEIGEQMTEPVDSSTLMQDERRW